jgi:hypothetical protein
MADLNIQQHSREHIFDGLPNEPKSSHLADHVKTVSFGIVFGKWGVKNVQFMMEDGLGVIGS